MKLLPLLFWKLCELQFGSTKLLKKSKKSEWRVVRETLNRYSARLSLAIRFLLAL
jgi:hypothetical protein